MTEQENHNLELQTQQYLEETNTMLCHITDESVYNPHESIETMHYVELDDLNLYDMLESEHYARVTKRDEMNYALYIENESNQCCDERYMSEDELNNLARFCRSFLRSYEATR